jgi:hypothetical protein
LAYLVVSSEDLMMYYDIFDSDHTMCGLTKNLLRPVRTISRS